MTSSIHWRKALTPSRLAAILSLLTISCAVIIASFSIGEERTQPAYAQRAARLDVVRQIVEATDKTKESLRQYEVTRKPEDKAAFLQACDSLALKVSHLREQEHISDEESGQIIDLCVSIRQQISRIESNPADRLAEAGVLVDHIRRVVLGLGMTELRTQDDRLAEQSASAALSRRITIGMAIIEIFTVAGIVLLVSRLFRLEQLATVCAWTHRLLYEGQWVSLERYLEQRFGVRASDGITTEQAARIMEEHSADGEEIIRLIEFEKMAGDRAREANRAIHAVRNHLTAVLCYSEMAGTGDVEAQRDMAQRVLTHASTISTEVDALHKAVRAFNPGPPDLHVVRHPEGERSVA
ncbi:MAG TPA: hypothetical protein VHY22_15460 [Chthoniobacteraceae bacterium]|jgi:hypothetical protein|nr:hypothetical protein [Chthoniobacteraceae bacterium]